jgi:aryl-alcohol dehydrogenase-like predicted oxidoreductase
MTTATATATATDNGAADLTDGQIDHLLDAMADSFARQTRAPILHAPSEHGLDYEAVSFPALDGVPLEGWFIPADGSDRLIIANHPMGFSRSGLPAHLEPWRSIWHPSGNDFDVDLVPDLKILHNAGYNVLAYDLRNHGHSGAANDAGVSLIDTAEFYGSGHNRLLIREALCQHRREDVVVSVKFGARRDPFGGWPPIGTDVDANAVKDRLAYTLRRLGTDYVDIYRPTRINPDIPVEETIGAIKEMIDAGLVKHIGLSEASVETMRRAAAVAPISGLQIEYSLLSRGMEPEILPTARELGVGITAYAVLSRGLLSGHWTHDRELSQSDFRNMLAPRFQGENLTANLALVEPLWQVASGWEPPSPRWRSPGWPPAVTTSSRWSAPADGTGWPSLSEPPR